MDKPTQRRWIILLSATAATAAASFYPTDKTVVAEPVVSGKRMPKFADNGVPKTDDALAAAPTGDADPFAPRGWKAPPPPPPPVQAAPLAQAPAVPPAPVGPPPLPFKFMGSMDDNGAQIIYLSRGDQAYIPHSGDTLGDDYKVLSMDSRHIEFEHVPTGEKQMLIIPASDN